jgi:hypothetical protein
MVQWLEALPVNNRLCFCVRSWQKGVKSSTGSDNERKSQWEHARTKDRLAKEENCQMLQRKEVMDLYTRQEM